ncbi:MAG: hypothetical protein ACE5I1_28305, partial [bacterium]
MIFSSIKQGFSQTWANKRMILLFYLASLVFGVVMMWPMRAMLSGFIGSSLMGEAGRMDMDFLFEFFKNVSAAPNAFMALVFVAPPIFWLFTLFLSGGALASFARGEKYTPSFFWGNAATYFGRFIRLALWSIPVFAILFCLQFLETGLQRLFFGSDPYQNISYWGGWIRFGLRSLGIFLFFIVLDYARIYIVLHDEKKSRIALWASLKFAFANFGRTFGLAFLLAVTGVVALTIYNPIANALSAPNGFVIILLLLVQQVYMFFRMILRLAGYSGQMNLYRGISEKSAERVPAPDDEVGLAGAM